jgi:hypothetical protein
MLLLRALLLLLLVATAAAAATTAAAVDRVLLRLPLLQPVQPLLCLQQLLLQLLQLAAEVPLPGSARCCILSSTDSSSSSSRRGRCRAVNLPSSSSRVGSVGSSSCVVFSDFLPALQPRLGCTDSQPCHAVWRGSTSPMDVGALALAAVAAADHKLLQHCNTCECTRHRVLVLLQYCLRVCCTAACCTAAC